MKLPPPQIPAIRSFLTVSLCLLLTGCSGAVAVESNAPETVVEVGESADIELTAMPVAAPQHSRGLPEDWPQLFGPYGNSRSEETGLNWDWGADGPPILWRQSVGLGYSVPVLRDNLLVVQQRLGDEEVLSCCDAETGVEIWACRFPATYDCKYDYSDGPYATPSISGDSVYAITADGHLLAVSFADGQLRWERNLFEDFLAKEEAFGVGVSPYVWQDRLILNIGGKQGNGIVAVSTADGQTLWTATNDPRGYSTAVVARQHDQWNAYVLTEPALVSLDPETGAVRWRFEFGIKDTPERANAVTPLVIGDLVVAASGPGPGTVVLKIAPDGSYQKVWFSRRVLDPRYTNMLHVDGMLYGVTSFVTPVFRSVDLHTGEELWEYDSELYRPNTLYVDGRVVLLGEYGHLAFFESGRNKPDPIWMSQKPLLEKPCYSAPALAGGRLYLRNEQEIVCLDLRRKGR